MLTVNFIEDMNMWDVVYLRLNPDGLHAMGARGHSLLVSLCRDCGMIMETSDPLP
jgi:hypothetical protein